jgi:hypothetical protein
MGHENSEIGHPITNMLIRQATAGDMATGDHLDSVGVDLATTTGEALRGDQVEELPPELADHLQKIDELLERGGEMIMERLEQVDRIEARTATLGCALASVESKLDMLLSHFGLLNTGS